MNCQSIVKTFLKHYKSIVKTPRKHSRSIFKDDSRGGFIDTINSHRDSYPIGHPNWRINEPYLSPETRVLGRGFIAARAVVHCPFGRSGRAFREKHLMFAKVFLQIFDSSIREHPEIRFTFMDFLVLANQDGVVDMTHEAIAARTNRPLDLIRRTITVLEGPDPQSRTPDFNGARIKRLDDHRDWGWFIVNYRRFRLIASDTQRREKTNARVKAHYKTNGRNGVNAPLTPVNAVNAKQKQKQKQSTDTIVSVAPTQLCWSSAGGWIGLTDPLRIEFSKAYPACDIPLQFRKMEQWLKANPKKAVKSNWRRFANNWLSRKQDKGGDLSSSTSGSKVI